MMQNAAVNAEAVEKCGDLWGLRAESSLAQPQASHVPTQSIHRCEPTGTYQ